MSRRPFRPVFMWFYPSLLPRSCSTLIVLTLLLPTLAPASAHDLWISRNNYKNPAGEWCCGAEDCGVVSSEAVKAAKGGYSLRGPVTYGVGVTGNEADGPTYTEQLNEVVPYSQALPSPDGAFWRCKRPDGSPRCFFAPQNVN